MNDCLVTDYVGDLKWKGMREVGGIRLDVGLEMRNGNMEIWMDGLDEGCELGYVWIMPSIRFLID